MSVSSMKVWIDGKIVDGSEARIPVIDHGLLYGDGIFEGIRVYGRRIFRLEAHMTRFATAARAIHLDLPGGIEHVSEVVVYTVRAFDSDEAYVRLIATRGDGQLGVDPTTCARPRLSSSFGEASSAPRPQRTVPSRGLLAPLYSRSQRTSDSSLANER
jgi:branched-chain amino acid aminotransferase